MAVDIIELFERMVERYDSNVTDQWTKNIQFQLTGEQSGNYYLHMEGDTCTFNKGEVATFDLLVKADSSVWSSVACGEIKGSIAIVKGLLEPVGDTQILADLKKIFGKAQEGDIWADANALAIRDDLRIADSLSLEELERLQEKRFRKLLAYAVEYCPFYRNLYENINIETCAVRDLPVITKKMVMENFEDIATHENLNLEEIRSYLSNLRSSRVVFRDKFIVGATSGTTGTPGVFCYNFEEWRKVVLSNTRGMDLIVEMERTGVIGPRGGTGEIPRFAMITAPNLDSLSAITIAHLPVWLFNTKTFSTLDTTKDLVDQLNEFDPFVICGHTSRLRDLAIEKIDGRLHITPKIINPFAEHVSHSVRKMLEKAFGGNVFIRYQASEVMNIGWECNSQRMHYNTDMMIIESVDMNNIPVANGTRGEKVLVTNLYNFTQPLIRYEISDIIMMSDKKCPCGLSFPLIERVEGRNDAILKFENEYGEQIKVFPFEIEKTLSEIENLNSYQVIQKSPESCCINYTSNNNSFLDMEKEIIDKLQNNVFAPAGINIKVQFEFTKLEYIPRDKKTGKFRSIINEDNSVIWGYTK